jgi:hypothetical protein
VIIPFHQGSISIAFAGGESRIKVEHGGIALVVAGGIQWWLKFALLAVTLLDRAFHGEL